MFHVTVVFKEFFWKVNYPFLRFHLRNWEQPLKTIWFHDQPADAAFMLSISPSFTKGNCAAAHRRLVLSIGLGLLRRSCVIKKQLPNSWYSRHGGTCLSQHCEAVVWSLVSQMEHSQALWSYPKGKPHVGERPLLWAHPTDGSKLWCGQRPDPKFPKGWRRWTSKGRVFSCSDVHHISYRQCA